MELQMQPLLHKWYVPYIGLGGNGKVGVNNNGYATVGFKNLRSGQEAGMLNYIQKND